MARGRGHVGRKRGPDRPGANVFGIAHRGGIHRVQGGSKRRLAIGLRGPAPGNFLDQAVDRDRITRRLEPRQGERRQARERLARLGDRL